MDYDVKTITAGDYTIEFDLTKQTVNSGKTNTYDYWLDHFYDKESPLSEYAQFRTYIQEDLEQICSKVENQGFEKEDKVKIAQVTMAYKNGHLIKRLIERGKLIKNEDWAKLELKNQEILDEIKKEAKVGEEKVLDQL